MSSPDPIDPIDPIDQDSCDHEWEVIDDSFDHEYGCEVIVYERCIHCSLQRDYERPYYEDDYI